MTTKLTAIYMDGGFPHNDELLYVCLPCDAPFYYEKALKILREERPDFNRMFLECEEHDWCENAEKDSYFYVIKICGKWFHSQAILSIFSNAYTAANQLRILINDRIVPVKETNPTWSVERYMIGELCS